MTCPHCGPSSSPADPRKQDSCIRCGRMLTPKVTETVRAGRSGDVARDVLLERRFTVEAARTIGVSPTALIAFAEGRTHPGPLRNAPARDWVLEQREEFADARNYACWEAQRIIAQGDAHGMHHLARALALTIMAWHELDLYEQDRAG